jgi:hypothetical protein
MNYAEVPGIEVIGQTSGEVWIVKNMGTAEAPNFIGHTLEYCAHGNRCEVHATRYEAVQNSPWGVSQSLVYDMAIHGNQQAFLERLQQVDTELSARRGQPRVGAHVGPTPPLLVDGINGDPLPRIMPAAEPTPQEQALLEAGHLHSTDFGYADSAAQQWL